MESFPFYDLPVELQLNILSRLSFHDREITLVSKHMNVLANIILQDDVRKRYLIDCTVDMIDREKYFKLTPEGDGDYSSPGLWLELAHSKDNIYLVYGTITEPKDIAGTNIVGIFELSELYTSNADLNLYDDVIDDYPICVFCSSLHLPNLDDELYEDIPNYHYINQLDKPDMMYEITKQEYTEDSDKLFHKFILEDPNLQFHINSNNDTTIVSADRIDEYWSNEQNLFSADIRFIHIGRGYRKILPSLRDSTCMI